METKVEIPLTIPKYAFWDTETEKLDLIRNKRNIISRIFNKGKLDDILKFIAFYGLEECIETLTGNEYLQEDAMYLAHTLLSVPLKDFKAYALHKHS